MTGWAFYAIGSPAPQGSKSVKGRTKTGRVILAESSKAVAPWRETVKLAAPAVERPLDGPLAVKMVFSLQRPASARKRDLVPCKTPDVSKLARSTEDAITETGLWADDARVSEYVRLTKQWWPYDDDTIPVPGVVVACVEIGPGYHHELDQLFYRARTEAIARTRGVA